VPRAAAIEVVVTLQDEFHGHLRDGDLLNSEAVVCLIEAPLGNDAADAASWGVLLSVHRALCREPKFLVVNFAGAVTPSQSELSRAGTAPTRTCRLREHGR